MDRLWRPRDRKDPESWRPPIPVRERLRIVLKVGAGVGAYLWFRSRLADGEHEGAAATVAFGWLIAAIAIVELLWVRSSTDAERIFTRTRAQAIALQIAGALLGGALIWMGLRAGA